jgi:hypothetical protein
VREPTRAEGESDKLDKEPKRDELPDPEPGA